MTESWIPALDLYPMDSLAAKRAFNEDAVAREVLVFFYHDPIVAAGYLREENGNRRVIPALS